MQEQNKLSKKAKGGNNGKDSLDLSKLESIINTKVRNLDESMDESNHLGVTEGGVTSKGYIDLKEFAPHLLD